MKICFWDIETSNLKGSYGAILASSIKPLNHNPQTKTRLSFSNPESDAEISLWTKTELEKYNIIVTFFGKGFDIKFLRTRLAYHNLDDVHIQWHLDCYWVVKNNLLPSRGSLAHLAEFLSLEEKKFSVAPQIWEKASRLDPEALKILEQRCASDVRVLEKLYYKILPFIKTIGK